MNKQQSQLQILGSNVKRLRLKTGSSQEEFSDLAGLHRTYISQLELGLRNPTYLTLEKIAKALNCSLSELFEAHNA